MQGIEEVERICYRNVLDQAEAHANAQGDEPTAEECLERCVHASACQRVLGVVCNMTLTEGMPHALGCAECDEYDDGAIRPRAWRLTTFTGGTDRAVGSTRCSRCGATVAQDDRYCRACGAALQGTIRRRESPCD